MGKARCQQALNDGHIELEVFTSFGQTLQKLNRPTINNIYTIYG